MKHNNLKVIALGFASFMLVATPALADMRLPLNIRATSSIDIKGRIEEKRAEFEAKQAERKAEFETKLEDKKTSFASSSEMKREKMEDKIEKRASSTAARMTATVGRLEKIITRIESRIAKVKAAGGVTVEAETAIAAAKVNLSAAKTDIQAFASIDVSGVDKASDKFKSIKAAAEKVKADIKSAHTNLMKAVKSLMMREKSAGVKATTTASTVSEN